MASPTVRTAIMTDITASNAGLKVLDMSQFADTSTLPLNDTGVMLLVQFVGGTDDMVDIGGSGNQGWEERGSVALHYLIPTGFDITPHLASMESLRVGLRGKRLGQEVVVEAITPFTDQISSSVEIDGGWHGWVSYASFYRYVCG